jgi:hypothetical protein
MTDRQIFGLVVRLLGIYLVAYGVKELWSGVALAARLFPSTGTQGYSASSYILTSLIPLLPGIALVRGEWLVRFAYGRES